MVKAFWAPRECGAPVAPVAPPPPLSGPGDTKLHLPGEYRAFGCEA